MILADHAQSLAEWHTKFNSLEGIEYATYWNSFYYMDDVCLVHPPSILRAYEAAAEEVKGQYNPPIDVAPNACKVTEFLVEAGLWSLHVLPNWEAYEFTHVSAFLKESPDSPCVYFLRAGNEGPIKIGRSTKLRSRLMTLQTGNHEDLRLLATMPGGRSVESMLHRQFATSRKSGEWFSPTLELLTLIREIGGML